MNGKVHTGKAGGTWLICGLSELRMTELDGDVWGAVHGGMSESVFWCVTVCGRAV